MSVLCNQRNTVSCATYRENRKYAACMMCTAYSSLTPPDLPSRPRSSEEGRTFYSVVKFIRGTFNGQASQTKVFVLPSSNLSHMCLTRNPLSPKGLLPRHLIGELGRGTGAKEWWSQENRAASRSSTPMPFPVSVCAVWHGMANYGCADRVWRCCQNEMKKPLKNRCVVR